MPDLCKRWPSQATPKEKIEKTLVEKLGENASYSTTKILGFPTMSPHQLGLATFQAFQAQHSNAILCHTRGLGEKGFDGIKDLERDVIHMVADLLGANPSLIDGYITSGGTEANIMGLWIGREKLRKDIPCSRDQRVSILASPMSHYSLRKACNILGLGEGSWIPCHICSPLVENPTFAYHIFKPARDGNGLHFVKADKSGRIDIMELERRIYQLYQKKGIRRFILFLNEGTTLTGAMDDTHGVGMLVDRLRKKWQGEVAFYVHVDAAYGGFVYPFIDPNGRWAFRVPEVDSLTVDPYKMGQAPMAQGIFICRKHLQKNIERSTGYVRSQNDDTLIGSRSGAHAAACWAIIQSEGREGFTKLHTRATERADSLHSFLRSIHGIKLLPRMLNMVAFTLPSKLTPDRLKMIEIGLIKPFHVMWDAFNTNPTAPSMHPLRIVKCNITRDVKDEWMNSFAKKLASLIN